MGSAGVIASARKLLVPLAYAAVGYGDSASSAGLTIAGPSGVVPGSFLLAGPAAQLSGAAWSPPDGSWTPIAGTGRGQLYWKFAGGSEPGSYAFTKTGGGSNSRGFVARFEGVDTSTPVAASAAQDVANGNAPDVTATQAGSLLFSLVVNVGTNTNTPVQPTGMALLFSSTATAFRAGAGLAVGAGAVGVKNWSVPAVTCFFGSVVLNKAA